VPAGMMYATFTVTALSVAASNQARITASGNGGCRQRL
jgi:hypothetical protein